MESVTISRWLLFAIYLTKAASLQVHGNTNARTNGIPSFIECPPEDKFCATDKFGFDAIHQLHLQIDDDGNGNLDRSESDGFLREEMKYEDDFERQSSFHGTDDQISVSDLWVHWVKSDVYNWTTEDVVDWLVDDLELPQYVESFKLNAVDGRTLPRIAANMAYTSSILGIKSTIHRQKIALKAMDVVLFGPHKKHSYMKDLILVASLLIAVGGCWLGYVQSKFSTDHLQKVMKDLEGLQHTENTLVTLQTKLDTAQKKHEGALEDKKGLEKKFEEEISKTKNEAEKLRQARGSTEEERTRLRLAEEELEQVRMALVQAEHELEEQHLAPSHELQQWLQLTYEIETQHYELKREAAEYQLLNAKEMCEKIRRKRGVFLGSLRIAHSTGMDSTDEVILKARAALEEIKTDMQERSQRWTQIEKLCRFNIAVNPGMQYLESSLRGKHMHSSQHSHDADDEDLSIAGHLGNAGSAPSQLSGMEQLVWPSIMQAGLQLGLMGLNKNCITNRPPAGMSYANQQPSRSYSNMYGTMPDVRSSRHQLSHSNSRDSLDRERFDARSISQSGLTNRSTHSTTSSNIHPSLVKHVTQASDDRHRSSDNDSAQDSDGSDDRLTSAKHLQKAHSQSNGTSRTGSKESQLAAMESSDSLPVSANPVSFTLGESSLPASPMYESNPPMPRSQSLSGESSITSQKGVVMRPKTLPAQLNEGAATISMQKQRKISSPLGSSPSRKSSSSLLTRNSLNNLIEQPQEEVVHEHAQHVQQEQDDRSSPESSLDSSSLGSKDNVERKSTRKSKSSKLFNKLMRKEDKKPDSF